MISPTVFLTRKKDCLGRFYTDFFLQKLLKSLQCYIFIAYFTAQREEKIALADCILNQLLYTYKI